MRELIPLSYLLNMRLHLAIHKLSFAQKGGKQLILTLSQKANSIFPKMSNLCFKIDIVLHKTYRERGYLHTQNVKYETEMKKLYILYTTISWIQECECVWR